MDPSIPFIHHVVLGFVENIYAEPEMVSARFARMDEVGKIRSQEKRQALVPKEMRLRGTLKLCTMYYDRRRSG